MRFSTKILIDHTVGRVLCYGLFPFVRVVGLLLRRDHSIRENNVKCITVAKYYGLGSIIHTMPMLRALKTQYPQARLIFITRRSNQPLIAHIPDIDQGLFVDDSTLISLAVSTLRLIRNLIKQRVDLFFDLELFSSYGALVSLFSFARNRLGFLCGLEADFKTILYTHLMYFNFQMPVRVNYLQLAGIAGTAAGASSDLIPPVVGVSIQSAARKKLENLLSGKRTKKRQKFLVFNVNATDVSLERRWMPERFAAVARHFAQGGFHILFVGSSDERPYVQGVVDRLSDLPDRIHNAAGTFTISEVLSVLKDCAALLTTDTGIMNFAYALDVPTVSLWGPDNPLQYHVPKGSTRAIWKSAYCSPCIYRFSVAPCRGNNVCMALIEVDEVISILDGLLKGEHGEQMNPVLPVCRDSEGSPLGLLPTHINRYKKEKK